MGLFGKKKAEEKKKVETPSEKKSSKEKAKTEEKVEAKPKKTEQKKESMVRKSAPKTEKPVEVKNPAVGKTTATGKTVYHVTKRDNDGREWKVFIQTSDKVIKLFPTQAEALAYAKNLCKNKDDGSYVMLHGLDGKIRKY